MTEPQGSRQTSAYVCLGITFPAAVITLVLRLTARRITKVSLWWDDWLAIIAFVFASVWTGLTFWWLQIGLGLYLNEIHEPADDVLQTSRLVLWNIELSYAFSLAFSKLAILALYWRMFKTSNIKNPIKVLVVCAIIWVVLRTFMAIFHCVPVQKFWDISVKGTCKINDSKFFFGTVLAHLLIDLAILVLPILQVRQLQLRTTQKIAVICMFGFGVFVCIASIVVLSESLKYDTSSIEMPWNIAPIIIWATAEVNLAIVSSCLPMLRPIYLLARRLPLSKNSSSGNTYPHQSGTYERQPSTAGTKLATINVAKKSDDDSDSTYKLAAGTSHREGSISDNSEYHAQDGNLSNVQGPSTVITGERAKTNRGEEEWGVGGIVVTNEIGVRVSRAK